MKKSNPVDLIMAMMREVNANEHRVSIPTLYIKLFKGNLTTALIAQECEYYTGLHQNEKDNGWFYMRLEDWHERYYISRKALETAIVELTGVVETKVKRAPDGDLAKYYRFNGRRMFGRIYNYMRANDMAKSLLAQARELGFATNRPNAPTVHLELLDGVQTHNEELQNHTTDHVEKSTPLSAKRKTERKQDELFNAIATTCQVDPATAGATIAKVKQALLQASPVYTVAEVETFGREWWAWPERKIAPTVWQLQERIGSVRAKRPNGRAVDGRRRPSPTILP